METFTINKFSKMKNNLLWQNNIWKDIDNSFLSIKDRGLRFSDGIFETILIKNSKPILLNEHLNRFEKTINLLKFENIIEKIPFELIIKEGIKKLGLNDKEYGSIRINYSRGINEGRSIKVNQNNSIFKPNNLWIEFYIIDINFTPISTNISKTEKRNEYSILSQCKTFSYGQSIQALLEANNKNFDDSLILNTSNELCCGTTFNLLLKRNNKWITPRKASGCQPGIMIDRLLKLQLIEEDFIKPDFEKNDILIAINSLFCRQIKRGNEIEFINNFDTKYYWDLLYI